MRVVDDLSHDLRQPMTSLTMNIQAAIRILRSLEPAPRVAAALEALIDCLDMERELISLVTEAQRHVSELELPVERPSSALVISLPDRASIQRVFNRGSDGS
jgi:signal transduction histidine kinase